MTILVEIYGHSGLGKTTLAHNLQADFKLNRRRSEFHGEYAKDVAYGFLEISMKEARKMDTERIQNLRKAGVDIIITDSNPFSGYIFGDVDYEESEEEANERWEGFERIVRIYLKPLNDISIDSHGRYENSLDDEIISRIDYVIGETGDYILPLREHISKEDVDKIIKFLQ